MSKDLAKPKSKSGARPAGFTRCFRKRRYRQVCARLTVNPIWHFCHPASRARSLKAEISLALPRSKSCYGRCVLDNQAFVSFVIPVRNDAARLRRCLATIAAVDYPDHLLEVVVADNGSVDDTRGVAAQAGARVVKLPGIRVSELRNRAAAMVQGEVIVFMDADHEIEPHWLRSALEVLQLPDVAVTGAICVAPSGGTWVQHTYDALRNHTPGRAEVEWIGSGTMALWRRVFEQVGGFDTRLETCEDVDLCRRIRAAGQRVMSDATLATLHWGDPATLGAVFTGELWRGRDNLRASLRGSLTWRSLPSIAIPLIDLGCLATALVGMTVASALIPIMALMIFVGLAGLRPARMVWRGGGGLNAIPPALLISCTHDLARSLALVWRAPHRRADLVPAQSAARA